MLHVGDRACKGGGGRYRRGRVGGAEFL